MVKSQGTEWEVSQTIRLFEKELQEDVFVVNNLVEEALLV